MYLKYICTHHSIIQSPIIFLRIKLNFEIKKNYQKKIKTNVNFVSWLTKSRTRVPHLELSNGKY